MGPLAGKKIIEFAGLGPAPVCGMLLADMGADVIVIDRKEAQGVRRDIGLGGKHAFMNRGKKSLALDLKSPDAAPLVIDLLREADALIEGFRPGVMERLGLGPEVCLEANPRLVYGRLTGWGQSGPLAHAAGHDINYAALSGALWYSGRAGTPPITPPTLTGDYCGGTMNLAVGLLAAMLHVQATGEGQVVDAAITDGAALSTTMLYTLFAGGVWSPRREDNLLDGGAHWYDCYECADGGFISIGSFEGEFYALLLEALGLADDPDFAQQYDRSRWPELKGRIADIFSSKTRDEWCELMEGTDICFAPVLDFSEAPAHPHNAARATFVDVDGVTQPGPAPRFSKTASGVAWPPPETGQDTDAVLEAAGYSRERRAALRETGVI
jgi:crotonobetainyl-CoA:carnitine CoA-transferase CaiB-like acyl-CoA transferase